MKKVRKYMKRKFVVINWNKFVIKLDNIKLDNNDINNIFYVKNINAH